MCDWRRETEILKGRFLFKPILSQYIASRIIFKEQPPSRKKKQKKEERKYVRNFKTQFFLKNV